MNCEAEQNFQYSDYLTDYGKSKRGSISKLF